MSHRLGRVVVAVLAAGMVPPAAGAEDDPTRPAPASAAWTISASAYTYLVPEDDDYVQPTVAWDRRWLHLESRYNYESLDTVSAWIGYNFEVGDSVTFAITPMLGGVLGEMDGVALGYEATLDWWKLELYTEGEFVLDAGNRADSFFYAWSQLTVSPLDWLQLGLVGQRTRVYESERDIQRGLLLGFSREHWGVAAYVFNPDDGDTLYVFSLELEFGPQKGH